MVPEVISWAYRKKAAAPVFPLVGLIDQEGMATTVVAPMGIESPLLVSDSRSIQPGPGRS